MFIYVVTCCWIHADCWTSLYVAITPSLWFLWWHVIPMKLKSSW